MPIYEYLCSECRHVLDALQKHADDPLVYCPECGAPALKRQLSAPSFRLKGSGWYETDFKGDKRRNLAESDSKAADRADAKPDAKADGKPGKSDKGDKSDESDKSEKAGKVDKPAAATGKAEGTGGTKKPGAGPAGGVA